ncbi:MAG TPA: hypothetical protein VFQ41_02950, partial [Candidatus Angelobacter sp.]|nr:hypothetical protein [Candidatus Angelobacter sp.]
YAQAMWEEDYDSALQKAHQIADRVKSPELAGYRAWWWFLASVAAGLMKNAKSEKDALHRGASCGVNSGWLHQLLQKRADESIPHQANPNPPNAETLWEVLTKWGWAGPGFEKKLHEMSERLKNRSHVAYHQGLETLGLCFGATTIRPTTQGAPDVVWSFPGDIHLAFEAKTEKAQDSKLSKSDLQEAKGHPEWVRANLCNDAEKAEVETIIISESSSLHQIALPFAGGIFYSAPQQLWQWSQKIADSLRKLRVRFSGREFAEAAKEFSNEMRNKGLDLDAVKAICLSEPLKKK